MKKIQKLCFLALVGLMVGTSCEKTPATPNPQDDCIEGVVIAENPRTTTPNALVACETVVQIKNRNIGEKFMSYDNCVVIRNLGTSLNKLNQKVYFKTFTEDSQCGPWQMLYLTPPASCIIVTNLSTKCEPK